MEVIAAANQRCENGYGVKARGDAASAALLGSRRAQGLPSPQGDELLEWQKKMAKE